MLICVRFQVTMVDLAYICDLAMGIWRLYLELILYNIRHTVDCAIEVLSKIVENDVF